MKKVYAYDTETTGLNPYLDTEMFAYSICDEAGKAESFRIDGADRKKNIRRLKIFFQNTNIIKVCHNYKFDMAFTKQLGISIPENTIWHDTMIMSQMLRNLAPFHALDYLAWELCGWSRDRDAKVKAMGKAYGGYQNIPKKLMHEYQCDDVMRTMILYRLWIKELQEDASLYKDYLNEIELIKVTRIIESNGIKISPDNCNKLIRWMEDELEKVQNECHKLLGEYVNLNSNKVVTHLLYEVRKYPVLGFTKAEQKSVDKNIILELKESYEDPLLDLILKQRSFTKGIAIISSYMKLANKDNIIFPSLKTNHAKTGREACSSPNLQNVSKEKSLKNLFPIPARKCFIAPDDSVLLFGDYAGIEMRIIIGLSQEKEMIDILNAGGDPHNIATELFYSGMQDDNLCAEAHIKPLKITKENLNADEWALYRGAGKNTHFALPYGSSIKNSAKTLNLPIIIAKKGLKEYGKKFPKINNFSRTIMHEASKIGYVKTLFGRILDIPTNKMYSAANYKVQGTAGGIIKRAQVNLHKFLKENYTYVKMHMPIHDEIIFSCPRKYYSKKLLRDLTKCMISIKGLNIKLDVEWKISTTNWNDAKEVKI